jgi:hypothetical protein
MHRSLMSYVIGPISAELRNSRGIVGPIDCVRRSCRQSRRHRVANDFTCLFKDVKSLGLRCTRAILLRRYSLHCNGPDFILDDLLGIDNYTTRPSQPITSSFADGNEKPKPRQDEPASGRACMNNYQLLKISNKYNLLTSRQQPFASRCLDLSEDAPR